MKTTLRKIIALTLMVTTFAPTAFCQQYLDNDKRFMKLTAVSTDKNYGFDFKNPIKVGTVENAVGAYLNSLSTLDGDKLHIAEMKLNYKNKKGLIMLILSYEQKKDLTTLYISEKEFEAPKAPFGFSFKTIDDLPKVIVFPADSIVKVTACSQTLYSVDDFLVKEKFGIINKPAINPTFMGGPDELKKYFVANPLTDEKATQMIFRVSIAFMVTCDGNAGNFVIVTKGKGDMATYANQVLAIVNKMPQKWQPATVDGKAVDCYQVLSFSPTGGQLDNVSYR
ncbi:MAG: hypothetical protein CVT94_12790 [Bacteroidetes bacterium HGW-Bacteroidetes-11]|jgi:hypothetical protein|nr:MAG: hypothetical protein CVT94_12790 [Bacteroidetes bacterium HGW-Bacteroidetes-11]